MTVRVSTPALYTDEIRAWDPTDILLLINVVPEDGETGVSRAPRIQLQVVSTNGQPIEHDTKVWITRGTTGGIDDVVDMAGGGVLPGYSGTAVYRQSFGSAVQDECIIAVEPAVPFVSKEIVGVKVEAHLIGVWTTPFPSWTYEFTIADYDHPEITGIVWLTPMRALVKLDEVPDDDSLYSFHASGNVEVLVGGHVVVRGAAAQATSLEAGMRVEVRGSDYAEDNLSESLVSATASGSSGTGPLDLVVGASTVADSGVDLDAQGLVVNRREIRCSVSRIRLEPRLLAEGVGTDSRSAERIQTAYVPLVTQISKVEEEDLPGGVSYGQWLYVDFDEPLSLGRLYMLSWYLGDVLDNWGESTFNFQLPRFGVTEGIDFWTSGIQAPTDKEDDLQVGDGSLRRMATILGDILLLQRYYAQVMTTLDDASACPDEWVPFLLYDRGNPFRFARESTRLGRKVAEFLPDLLRKKGTALGIEIFIQRVLDIRGTCIPFWTADHWRLGDPVLGRLGHTTILGPGTAYERNCWVFLSTRDISDEEEARVTEVCAWADPFNLHFIGVIEPSDIAAGTTVPGGGYWILGTSALGSGTLLAP